MTGQSDPDHTGLIDPPRFETALRVRWHECDPQGIVFNAHFLAYFDMAAGDLWNDLLEGRTDLGDFTIDSTVVAEARVRYLAPARYRDELIVTSTITHVGVTSFTFGMKVTRDGNAVAEGDLRCVFVDPVSLKKSEPPEAVRRLLRGAN